MVNVVISIGEVRFPEEMDPKSRAKRFSLNTIRITKENRRSAMQIMFALLVLFAASYPLQSGLPIGSALSSNSESPSIGRRWSDISTIGTMIGAVVSFACELTIPSKSRKHRIFHNLVFLFCGCFFLLLHSLFLIIGVCLKLNWACALGMVCVGVARGFLNCAVTGHIRYWLPASGEWATCILKQTIPIGIHIIKLWYKSAKYALTSTQVILFSVVVSCAFVLVSPFILIVEGNSAKDRSNEEGRSGECKPLLLPTRGNSSSKKKCGMTRLGVSMICLCLGNGVFCSFLWSYDSVIETLTGSSGTASVGILTGPLVSVLGNAIANYITGSSRHGKVLFSCGETSTIAILTMCQGIAVVFLNATMKTSLLAGFLLRIITKAQVSALKRIFKKKLSNVDVNVSIYVLLGSALGFGGFFSTTLFCIFGSARPTTTMILNYLTVMGVTLEVVGTVMNSDCLTDMVVFISSYTSTGRDKEQNCKLHFEQTHGCVLPRPF